MDSLINATYFRQTTPKYDVCRFPEFTSSFNFSGRCSHPSRESLSLVLSALGTTNPSIGDMLLELCVTELEDVATDTERFKGVPQPVTQESPHPYTGNLSLYLHVHTTHNAATFLFLPKSILQTINFVR